MCTRGKNGSTELKCASEIPMDHIVRVVTSPSCLIEVRISYHDEGIYFIVEFPEWYSLRFTMPIYSAWGIAPLVAVAKTTRF